MTTIQLLTPKWLPDLSCAIKGIPLLQFVFPVGQVLESPVARRGFLVSRELDRQASLCR